MSTDFKTIEYCIFISFKKNEVSNMKNYITTSATNYKSDFKT